MNYDSASYRNQSDMYRYTLNSLEMSISLTSSLKIETMAFITDSQCQALYVTHNKHSASLLNLLILKISVKHLPNAKYVSTEKKCTT